MSQAPELNPKEGEEIFAAITDNKHNKTHVRGVDRAVSGGVGSCFRS